MKLTDKQREMAELCIAREAAGVTDAMVEALRNIDAEAPAKEPRDDWTSTDLDEAFYEGKLRGFWEMAVYAREALTAVLGAQTPPEGAVTEAMVEAAHKKLWPAPDATFIAPSRDDIRAALEAALSAIEPTQALHPTPDAPGCEWCSFTGLQADGETPCPCTDAGLTANAEFLRRAEAAEAEVEKLRAEVEFQCNRAKRAETLWKADINSWHKTEARLAEAVEVLRPFADTADHDIGSDEADSDTFRPMTKHNRAAKITVGDMRRAFNFLQSLSKEA